MDRRALFFMVSAVVCAALIPATPADLRWVPISMAIAYPILALWSYLDYRGRRAMVGPRGGAPDTVAQLPSSSG